MRKTFTSSTDIRFSARNYIQNSLENSRYSFQRGEWEKKDEMGNPSFIHPSFLFLNKINEIQTLSFVVLPGSCGSNNRRSRK